MSAWLCVRHEANVHHEHRHIYVENGRVACRSRPARAGFKPRHGAVVKSHGGGQQGKGGLESPGT